MSEWDLACTRGHPDVYGVVNLYTARKSFAFDLAPLIKAIFSCFYSEESYHEFFPDNLFKFTFL